jgi:hypothetical protein
LLPWDFACPATTTALNGDFSLQLIVESLSTGADHQVTPAIICNDSFRFIDMLASEGAQFAQIFHWPGDLNSSQLIVDLISGIRASTNIINGSFKLQQLIVIYSKWSLHFRKDCGIFCEGEWEQHQHLIDFIGLAGLASLNSLIKFNGLIDFIGVVGFIGIVGLSCLVT